MNNLRQLVALLDCKFRRVDWFAKSHGHFSGTDDQRIFLHDTVRSRTGHRHNRNSSLDRNRKRTLLESLQTSVRTARPLWINKKRKTFTNILQGYFDAFERGVAIASV